MDYIVREVDLNDPAIRPGVDSVLADAFGSDSTAGGFCDHVQKVTCTKGSHSSLHLAAMIGTEVVGYNAFISHDLIYEGRVINCYQSCFTATSSQHRGKKIFQNLILAAHDILGARGAAFVFGFPNDNSYPLFTKKLQYRELPSTKIQMLNIPLYRRTFFRKSHPTLEVLEQHAILQNDKQLIELKRLKYGSELLTSDFEGSTAWGLRRSIVRRGIKVPYLDLGGLTLTNADHLVPLLRQLRKHAGWVAYMQVVTIAGSTYNRLFQKVQKAETNCLIVYDLNMKTDEGVTFNFFNGVRDVY